MSKQRLRVLFERYRKASLSADEIREWENLTMEGRFDEAFQEFVEELWRVENDGTPSMKQEDAQRILQKVIATKSLQQSKTISLFQRWMAAAIAVILVTGGYFFYQLQGTDGKDQLLTNDITPGKNGATLTLSDGRKILISDALTGNIAQETGVKISKSADGQLIYEILNNNIKTLTYNTLATTKGEQTQVRLPDGTVVFLNAESSLRYPINFKVSAKREVVLAGEGYFEVARDTVHPFVVRTGQQEVEVLGTSFNINSYDDEPALKTTLLEGAVALTNLRLPDGHGQRRFMLRPGEQAILSVVDQFKLQEVDVEEAIAWKNGKFVFDDEEIESIMRRLSRWYNVEIVYQGDVKQRQFTGSISRHENISRILDKMSYTQNIRFEVKGRRITVMP